MGNSAAKQTEKSEPSIAPADESKVARSEVAPTTETPIVAAPPSGMRVLLEEPDLK